MSQSQERLIDFAPFKRGGEPDAKPTQGRVTPAPIVPRAMRRKVRFLLYGAFFFAFLMLGIGPRAMVVIEPGERGVLFRALSGGTVTDHTFGEGLHFVYPWDQLTRYDVRRQERAISFDSLMRNGLTVRIGLSIHFHPQVKDLGFLHRDLGPAYIDTILIPEIITTVRETIGSYTPEELYTFKRAVIQQEITLSGLIDLSDKYVVLDAIYLTSLSLPEQVNIAIEDKEVEDQRAKEYEWRNKAELREAERKRIEAEGLREANELVASSLSKPLLEWQALEATVQVVSSENAELVLIGSGPNRLPVVAGGHESTAAGGTRVAVKR